jgi:hypothetical protein
VVKGDTVVECSIEAWTAGKVLLHRREGARATGQICISADGTGTSGEVMIKRIMSAAARVTVARS